MFASSSTTTIVPFSTPPILTPRVVSSVDRLGQRRVKARSSIDAISADHLPQPRRARLHRPGLGRPIHADEPEPHPIPERPLEVVEQRPVEEAPHVETVADRPGHPL